MKLMVTGLALVTYSQNLTPTLEVCKTLIKDFNLKLYTTHNFFFAENHDKFGWERFQSLVKFGSQEFICHLQISRQSQLIFSWVSVLGDKNLGDKYSCEIVFPKPFSSWVRNNCINYKEYLH